MDEVTRKGDWFQTFTGRQFWPVDPRPEDFEIVDIAHALSNTCRFNGHTVEFYSVAQHCVLVAEVVPPDLKMEGLLHDAAEAYIGDMVRPAKLSMPEYREIENRIEMVLADAFGLKFPWPTEVKAADNRLLATERRDLLGVYREWNFRGEPLSEKIVPWPPRVAKDRFLEIFYGIGT